jgi:hypothetical protein
MADNFPILAGATLQGAQAAAAGFFSTSFQPGSSYWNSDGASRGCFMATARPSRLTMQFEICESIQLSPLSLYNDEMYFGNVNTLSVQLNFNAVNLQSDIWVTTGQNQSAGAAAVTVANVTGVAISNPQLELTYIQVPNDLVAVPRLLSYPYENVQIFARQQNNMSNVGALDSGQFISDTLRFSSMPSLIYVFARPILSARVGTQCDAFLGLGQISAAGIRPNVQITLGNRSGLLSSAASKTLYRMSQRNGYNSTYQDWQYGSGSLLIIDPVEDLGVNLQAGDYLPGESGSVNFQYTATYNSQNWLLANGITGVAPIACPTELCVIAVYSGVCNITPNSCVTNTGDLSEAEVNALLRTAPVDGSMMSSEVLKPTIQGGGFASKYKSLLGHAATGLQALHSSGILDKLSGKGMAMGGVLSSA